MPFALPIRSEEHTSELQSPCNLVCRLLLEKKKKYRHRAICLSRSLAASIGPDHRRARPGDANLVVLWERSAPFTVTAAPFVFFFFNDTATTEIYTLSLHDALPIYIIIIVFAVVVIGGMGSIQ